MQDTLKWLITACAVVGIIACLTTCEMKRYDVNKEVRLSVPSECAVK